MEIDGEQYYLKQAELNKNNILQRAFLLLAKAEGIHAELIRRKIAGTIHDNPDDTFAEEIENLFSNLSDYKRDVDHLPGQLDIYLVAMEMEQKSIDLYQDMLDKAETEKDQWLLKFLVKQEQDHYHFFDELAELLKKPNEWVEAAEFGPREEY